MAAKLDAGETRYISLHEAACEILESKNPGSTLGKTKAEIRFDLIAETDRDFAKALKKFSDKILMNNGGMT